jgi:long-chain fatty acid transport protein
MKHQPISIISALVALAFSGTAAASGFQLIEQNASGIGNAYAGSAAVAENASTIFYNPAGMTQLKAREVSLGLSMIRPSFKFSNNGSSGYGPAATAPGAASPARSGDGGDAGSWNALPNAYLSWALNKDIYLGLGLGAPFGLNTEYDKNWLGAAHSVMFDIKTYNINPSVAFRVNDLVSLGAGINYMKMEAEYKKTQVLRLSLPAGGFITSPARLKADDDAWGWNVGALFTLSPATRIGLSYRSKVKQNLEGNLTVNAQPAAMPAGARVDAAASLELPDTFIVSLAQKLNDRWELLADVSWTGWSSIQKVDIKCTGKCAQLGQANGATVQTLGTKFDDTWRVALGANYQIDPSLKLKFGIAYDQTPVPDAQHRLVSLPDNDRLWLSFGAQWKPSQDAALDLGVSYLDVKNTKIDNNGGTSGYVKGDYDSNCWIVGMQYSMAF